jgi:succinyl-CoA synthetase alpha subunit
MSFVKRSKATNFVSLVGADAGTVLVNGDKYVGTQEMNGKNGPFTSYLFESDTGEIISIGASGQLKYKMETESEVQIGERIHLTFLGKEMIKGRECNQFELLVEDTSEEMAV